MIRLYFITGFLGSGKTTLMNRLIKFFPDKKKGVIVNEFGDVGIDASLLPNPGSGILELNGGQIFCSCLLGNFIDGVVSYADMPIEYLFVETSGLAYPSCLDQTLSEISVRASGKIEYKGMICVIDAVNFFDLIDVIRPVGEQIAKSDVAVINKTDLVNGVVLSNIETVLAELNPRIEMVWAMYCDISNEVLEMAGKDRSAAKPRARKLANEHSRQKSYTIFWFEPVKPSALLEFMKSIIRDMYRMKGFLKNDGTWLHIDAVGEHITMEAFPGTMDGNGVLTLIAKSNTPLSRSLEASWGRFVGVAHSILPFNTSKFSDVTITSVSRLKKIGRKLRPS